MLRLADLRFKVYPWRVAKITKKTGGDLSCKNENHEFLTNSRIIFFSNIRQSYFHRYIRPAGLCEFSFKRYEWSYHINSNTWGESSWVEKVLKLVQDSYNEGSVRRNNTSTTVGSVPVIGRPRSRDPCSALWVAGWWAMLNSILQPGHSLYSVLQYKLSISGQWTIDRASLPSTRTVSGMRWIVLKFIKIRPNFTVF